MHEETINECVSQIIVALIHKDEIVIKNPNDYQEDVLTAIKRIKSALSGYKD